jgi:transposase-like protein
MPNGAKTAEVCRRHGISGATFYAWKAKFGGMEPSEAKRLKALEDENAKGSEHRAAVERPAAPERLGLFDHAPCLKRERDAVLHAGLHAGGGDDPDIASGLRQVDAPDFARPRRSQDKEPKREMAGRTVC